ncbi:MAG: protein kinase domain-containing protein [Planctomycetota bacterium]
MLGTAVGGFRILSALGEGGMGSVYLAEAERDEAGVVAGSRVALKVLHPSLIESREAVERFEQEAEAGWRVEHENVVRTLGAGVARSNGTILHYLVMEYVEGRTLRQLLTELKTVPEALLREIALQTAAGLAAIHEQGMVHRDLKPENAIITDDQRVRIMDLGVAKLLESTDALTQLGQFAGSVLYAAPEQFGVGTVGPATDLYALGVVLYELATGENPFARDETGAIMHAQISFQPPAASEREVSTFFSEVLRTLLAKDPAERFESARALLDTLVEGQGSDWWSGRERELRAKRLLLPRVPVRRETALHGRESDLDRLGEAWVAAQDGHGRTILVEGEAGLGKSRLMDAFLQSLKGQECHVLYGSYPPSGGLGGMSDAILGKFGRAHLEEAIEPYLTVTPGLVPALAALLRHEPAPEGAHPLGPEALAAVHCHLAQALAGDKPTVWIVEDLHFAPQESMQLVQALARALAGHRILLLLTARPELPDDQMAHFARLDNFERVAIERLAPALVRELLLEALRSERLVDKLADRIAEKSDGVPFFVFEMIASLKEGTLIRRLEDGSFVESEVIDQIEVPSRVRDLIEARLGDLKERERELLDVAAAIGYEFDPHLVAEVCELRPVRLLQILATVERRSGVVRASGRLYRFDHHQIQEVVYSRLSESLRCEYHTLLARTCERRVGEEPGQADGETAHFLAFHHLRGNAPEEAVPHLRRALDHLVRAFQNGLHLDLSYRALSIEGLLEERLRHDVLLKRATRLQLIGHKEEERPILDEALEIAEQLMDAGMRAQTLWALGHHFWSQSHYEEARERLSEAFALAPETGDKELEGRCASSLGLVHWNLGEGDAAGSCFDRAAELGKEIGNKRLESIGTGNRGLVYSAQGHYEKAQEHYERYLQLAREGGDKRGESIACTNLGNVMANFGRYAECQEYQLRSRDLDRQVGLRRGEAISEQNLGFGYTVYGNYEKARRHLERSVALAREVGDQRSEAYALAGLGTVADREGDLEKARLLHEQVFEMRKKMNYRPGIAESLLALASLDAKKGLEDSAADRLDEALNLGQELENPSVILAAATAQTKLPGGDAAFLRQFLAEYGSRVPKTSLLEVYFLLWDAQRSPMELAEAHHILRLLRDHAPEDCRETMFQNVELHRRIAEAWRQQG